MSVEESKWQELCEAASNEHDSEHLMVLISELIKTLDEQKSASAGRVRVPGHIE